MAVPLVVSVVDVLGVEPTAGLDPTPFVLVVPGALFAWALAGRDLFETLPVVNALDHPATVAEMTDGVVVLDADDYVVECNAAASALAATADPVGTTFETAFSPLSAALDDDTDAADTSRGGTDGTTLTVRFRTDDDGFFDVGVSSVQATVTGRGTVVTPSELTDRTRRDQRLDVLNRVLRHNVCQEVTMILDHVDALREHRDVGSDSGAPGKSARERTRPPTTSTPSRPPPGNSKSTANAPDPSKRPSRRPTD